MIIGLLNNMPPAGMQTAARQICSLLDEASGATSIRLKMFAPAQAARTPAVQYLVDRYYEPCDALERQELDALIVTGAEPHADRLEDEPAWPGLCRVVDHAEITGTPVLWSCMAAHAAIYRLAAVHRRRLPAKLSGLFLCRASAREFGLPRSWMQPHSRFYGVERRALREAGVRIISSSPEGGPDMFALRRGAEHLFLQGHPEYGFSTLPSEFRRDVARFLRGTQGHYPRPPAGYYGRAVLARLAAFEQRARLDRQPALLAEFDAIACDVAAEHTWRPVALQIYRNWLSRVVELRDRRVTRAEPSRAAPPLASISTAFGRLLTASSLGRA